jgi:hypothetical protein
MKKIISISAALVAVIFIGMTLSSFAPAKVNNTSDATIQYKVVVHPDWTIQHNQCPLMVAITDGTSKVIGQPQRYQYGVSTYYFYETGSFSGTRIAILTNLAVEKPVDVCLQVSSSDSKRGNFINGVTYVFDLYGSAKNIIEPDNSTTQQ